MNNRLSEGRYEVSITDKSYLYNGRPKWCYGLRLEAYSMSDEDIFKLRNKLLSEILPSFNSENKYKLEIKGQE